MVRVCVCVMHGKVSSRNAAVLLACLDRSQVGLSCTALAMLCYAMLCCAVQVSSLPCLAVWCAFCCCCRRVTSLTSLSSLSPLCVLRVRAVSSINCNCVCMLQMGRAV